MTRMGAGETAASARAAGGGAPGPVARGRLLAPRSGELRRRRGPRGRAAGRRGGRQRTEVSARAGRVAALVHDPALGDEPELVAAAGAAAGWRSRTSGCQAELRARLDELQPRARASSRPATASGGGSSATCTTARSSGSSRFDRRSGCGRSRSRAKPRRGPDRRCRPGARDGAARSCASSARGIHPAVLTDRGLEPGARARWPPGAAAGRLDVADERLPDATSRRRRTTCRGGADERGQVRAGARAGELDVPQRGRA